MTKEKGLKKSFVENEDWLDYINYEFPEKEMHEITKFNLKSSAIGLPNNQKVYLDNRLLSWLEKAERTNKIPQSFLQKIILTKSNSKSTIRGSYRKFKEKNINLNTFSSILYNAFGSDNETLSRPYGSGGALYPINTFLILLKDNSIGKLKSGAYYYQPIENALYKLVSFENISEHKIKIALYPNINPTTNIAIAYAADLRKAVRKYKFLGYKNALIEVGLMAQSLKQALEDNMGEYSSQDFNSALLTDLIGLDVQNAPVEMIQWIGLISND